MLPEQRRRHIVDLMHRDGAADVRALARLLGVSGATIRRDLGLLEEQGLLTRTHGGAVPSRASTAFEPRYEEKARLHRRRKEAIAAAACERVEDGAVVVLDSGSTTHALARELKVRRHGLSIITTDLMIALELADVPGFEVVIAGGSVRPGLYSVVGPLAEGALTGLHANHAFLGADAVSPSAGVTNANLVEVGVKRQLIASSEDVVLLADHSKFGRVSLAHVAPLEAFALIVVDDGLPEHEAQRYRDLGATLVRAAPREAPP